MKKRIKTKPLNAPTPEANRVARDINQLVKRMSKDYGHTDLFQTELLEALRIKYDTLFDIRSTDWAARIGDSALRSADSQVMQSLKDISKDATIGKLNLTENIKKTFQFNTKESAELFKTIPAQFHGKVQSVVFNSITNGRGIYDIAKYIKKFDNGTRNYVQLRTMDQTRKAFSALSRERMVAAGITKFQWLHQGGSEKPREIHLKLNGKVFDIDSPPFIGVMYGYDVYGFPSQLPNCRCRASYILADI